jgi:O-methyltransferase
MDLGSAGSCHSRGLYRGRRLAGGSGCLLAKAAEGSGKITYLADTFGGVVKAGDNDTSYVGGEHSDTTESIVQNLLSIVDAKNTKILKGIFPEETSVFIPGPISLLHIDVDVYKSAKDILSWAFPRLSQGSIVVFDDYGFDRCSGITRFVNEYDLLSTFCFLYNLNGHAVLIKR